MSDTAEVSDTPKENVVSENAPKKSTRPPGRPRKPKPPNWHPTVATMVESAITDLREKRGSSLPAIKKYVDNNYNVDMNRMTHLIKKYLKTAVASGTLLQTKGKGASGSFKLKTSRSAKAGKPVKKIIITKKKTKSKVSKKTKKTATTVKKPKPKSVKAEKKSKNVKSPRKPKSKTVDKAKPKKISKSPSKKIAIKKEEEE